MEMPKPVYRVLWTWDYCTFWDDSYYVRGRGAFGENKRRACFLEDYKRMVDYGAGHGVNGIVIWGALRAHDDGEAQLQELIAYGKEKGVRILPGVGIFSYGGVYYDTRKAYNGWMDIPMERHPRSLHSWLKDHPEYAAIGPDGKPYQTGMYSDIACPSKKENLDWFLDAIAWLFEEFGVQGVQMEIGDYAVCHCEDCTKKRASARDASFAVEDMVAPYAAACDVIRRHDPGAWAICETYSSFATPKAEDIWQHGASAFSQAQKRLLSALPENAVLQWMVDRAVGRNATQDWAPDVYLPKPNNIARIHAGSQHSLNSTEDWAIHTIGDLVKKARMSGVNGVSIFGEESPASPPNEANYLVFAEFSGFGADNPACDMERFYSRTLDPLFGGGGMARAWERIYVTGHILRLNRKLLSPAVKDPLQFHPVHKDIGRPELVEWACGLTPGQRRDETLKLIREARALSATLSGEPCRRWAWLENWLWRAEFLHRTNVSGL